MTLDNRIDQKFAALKAANKKALITFIMAGDPDEAGFVKTLDSLPASGAAARLGACRSG